MGSWTSMLCCGDSKRMGQKEEVNPKKKSLFEKSRQKKGEKSEQKETAEEPQIAQQTEKEIRETQNINDKKIIICGPSSSGKTSILNIILTGEPMKTVPTKKTHIEYFNYQELKIAFWDLGSESDVVKSPDEIYVNTAGIICVVDSCIREKILSASVILENILNKYSSCPILIMANKQDIKEAISADEVCELMKLKNFNVKWFLQSCSINNKNNVNTGLNWLIDEIKQA